MLSNKDAEFMSNKMKIDLGSIEDKFNEEEIIECKKKLEGAIAAFLLAIYDQRDSGVKHDTLSIEDSDAEKSINNYACDLSDSLANDEAKHVLDALRSAFSSFAYNGLHQLFTRQENHVWYPKILLDEELKPNDIDVLPNIITLYRGTDVAEFNTKNYGQSWTTCNITAHDFAFKHYSCQPWFKKSERIVIETEFSKKYVYFSCQSCEFEVVIDTSKISEVHKCTKQGRSTQNKATLPFF